MEGNLHFQIDSGSPLVGTKFTIFALFYFVFEGNVQVQAPGGGLYLQGREGKEVFVRYEFGGPYIHGELIFGILRYAFAVPQAIQFPLPYVRVSNSFFR